MVAKKRELAGTVTDVTPPAPAPTPKAAKKKAKQKAISENPAASIALLRRARRGR